MTDHPITRLSIATMLLAFTATFAFAQDDETYEINASRESVLAMAAFGRKLKGLFTTDKLEPK